MNRESPWEASAGRVLIVDDDRINRTLLTRGVEQEGHEAHTAENGRDALELLRDGPFDLVLLDIVMPELDGVSVLDQIKSDPRLQHVPVIMISAVDEVDSVVRCIEMGAEDYLPKPFDPVILRARINAGLAKKRLHDVEQERVRSVFSRFMPEHVVDDVLQRTDEDLRLGGSRDVGTIMFTDIRGFTAFSESAEPQLVIHLLNQYFGEMIDAIFGQDGTWWDTGATACWPSSARRSRSTITPIARSRRRARCSRCACLASTAGWRSGARRAVRDGHRPEQQGVHVRQRRLGTPARVHRPRGHREHGRAPGGDDQEHGALAPLAESTYRALSRPPGDLDFVGELEVQGRRSALGVWTLKWTRLDAADQEAGSVST